MPRFVADNQAVMCDESRHTEFPFSVPQPRNVARPSSGLAQSLIVRLACIVPLYNTGETVKYVTLSYVWGHGAASTAVSLTSNTRPSAHRGLQSVEWRSTPYQITKECYHPPENMSIFRLKSYRYVPLVDAVCLNQSDDAEKAQQVP